MDTENQQHIEIPEIQQDDFVRRFTLRAPQLMWLLGAGASASAGLPTANDMIWRFKQDLYVSQRRVSRKTVDDLSSVVIRNRLQSHINSINNLPESGDPDEYAALFEEVYPSESDRRLHIDSLMTGAKPSYGHYALATLMHAQLTRIVWTTNFDALIADACASVFKTTSPLTNVTLDAPYLGEQAVGEERWPVVVQLHGDFRSRRLKNTIDELRKQDEILRNLLIELCSRFGLVVVGYSGRDRSIMDALFTAMDRPNAFPSGLFWLHCTNDRVSPNVCQLIKIASEKGIEAGVVSITNFDELLRDLIHQSEGIDPDVLQGFSSERRYVSSVPRLIGKHNSWPVVRLNALPVIQTPSICYKVDCEIGGSSEVRAAINDSGVDVIAVRTKAGVLAFGTEEDIRVAFDNCKIKDIDLYTLQTSRQRYDSSERRLIREALTRAVERHLELRLIQHGREDVMAPIDVYSSTWQPLKRITGALSGTIPNCTDIRWSEGIGLRIEWANDRLWLIFRPRTVFEGITTENKHIVADFGRERSFKRYNKLLNSLFEFWCVHLSNSADDLMALGLDGQLDAVFRVSKVTGFSRRLG